MKATQNMARLNGRRNRHCLNHEENEEDPVEYRLSEPRSTERPVNEIVREEALTWFHFDKTEREKWPRVIHGSYFQFRRSSTRDHN